MLSAKAIVGLVLGSTMISAAFAKTSVQTITTNGESAYVVSAGTCGTATEQFGMISSKFSYTVCQEKITQDYNVTTSDQWYDWKSQKEAIPGTKVVSYELEQKEEGDKYYLNQQHPAPRYMFPHMVVQQNCAKMQNLVAHSVLKIKDTPCGK
jgi:hypothetical protein